MEPSEATLSSNRGVMMATPCVRTSPLLASSVPNGPHRHTFHHGLPRASRPPGQPTARTPQHPYHPHISSSPIAHQSTLPTSQQDSTTFSTSPLGHSVSPTYQTSGHLTSPTSRPTGHTISPTAKSKDDTITPISQSSGSSIFHASQPPGQSTPQVLAGEAAPRNIVDNNVRDRTLTLPMFSVRSSDLSYRGEGHEHMVLRVLGTGQVLRLRKTPVGVETEREVLLQRAARDEKFLRKIARPLLGALLTDESRLVAVSPLALDSVSATINTRRKANRVHKEINKHGIACVCPDAASTFITRREASSSSSLSLTSTSDFLSFTTICATSSLSSSSSSSSPFSSYSSSSSSFSSLSSSSPSISSSSSSSSLLSSSSSSSLRSYLQQHSTFVPPPSSSSSSSSSSSCVTSSSFLSSSSEHPSESLPSSPPSHQRPTVSPSAPSRGERTTGSSGRILMPLVESQEPATTKDLKESHQNNSTNNLLFRITVESDANHEDNTWKKSSPPRTSQSHEEDSPSQQKGSSSRTSQCGPNTTRRTPEQDFKSSLGTTQPSDVEPKNICIEIKPKQGFLDCSIPGLPLCRFCIKQYLKASRDPGLLRTSYCPLDLFSGDAERMKRAIDGLIASPQNYLKMFVDGEPVDDMTSYSHLREVIILALTHNFSDVESRARSLQDCIISPMSPLGRTLTFQRVDHVGVLRAAHLYNVLVEKIGSCKTTDAILQDLEGWTLDAHNHCPDSGNPEFNSFKDSSYLSASNLSAIEFDATDDNKDISAIELNITKPSATERIPTEASAIDLTVTKPAATEHSSTEARTIRQNTTDTNANKSNTLELKSVKNLVTVSERTVKVDTKCVELGHQCKMSLDANAKSADLKEQKPQETSSRSNTSDIQEEIADESLSQEEIIRKLQEYLLSVTAKDLSLMVLLSGPHRGVPPRSHAYMSPFILILEDGGWYRCQVTGVDLVAKPPTKILKHERDFKRLRDLLLDLKANGHEPPCCVP